MRKPSILTLSITAIVRMHIHMYVCTIKAHSLIVSRIKYVSVERRVWVQDIYFSEPGKNKDIRWDPSIHLFEQNPHG